MKNQKGKQVTLAHGAGGAVMQELIKNKFVKSFSGLKGKVKVDIGLHDMDDSGVIADIVFTTDSHTVKPLFFPGGDIGSLSVAGTVNDLSVMGAEPLALSSAFIIEEGFPVDDLEKIIHSMSITAKKARVPIITGDTKVVENGAIDGLMINTSGIGRANKYLGHNNSVARWYRKFSGPWMMDSNLKSGDKIIVSGYIGDHGIAVLSSREGYGFDTKVKSDVQPLNKMIGAALRVGGIVAMKDPTRGGLANALNEWSEKSHTGILIDEKSIPLRGTVQAACEMLGIDPLNIGNEGKVIIGVVKEKAESILESIRKTKEGKDAAIIGEARKDFKGVVMNTVVGGKRIIDQPSGDPVPRIC